MAAWTAAITGVTVCHRGWHWNFLCHSFFLPLLLKMYYCAKRKERVRDKREGEPDLVVRALYWEVTMRV